MPTPAHCGTFIDSQADLDAASTVIAAQTTLPLDTEFARTDTYRPKLCLLQVAVPGRVYCADTLAGVDLGGFWRAITAPSALKVMHAAKQDMEVLLLHFGALPGPLFDTQIAAALLGHPPQTGYATLVEAELGLRLDKSQTRTDWSRRPLTGAQIEYAANDVAHLAELRERLCARLAGQGREQWAEEDCAALLDPAQYAVQPDRAWERLPAVGFQPPPVQARAQRLAAWRERRAGEADRPRQWILGDQALMALASAAPPDVAGILALDVMPPGAVRNSGAAILAELRQAEADLASGALNPTQQPRPAATDNSQVKRLGAVVQKVATGLGIAPEILATRSDMTALLRGARDVRPMRGWRRAIIGDALLDAL